MVHTHEHTHDDGHHDHPHPEGIARRHVCDALSAVPVLEPLVRLGMSLLDIGSGGGYPGLPLAAALPLGGVSLLDSVGKKARFLEVAGDAVARHALRPDWRRRNRRSTRWEPWPLAPPRPTTRTPWLACSATCGERHIFSHLKTDAC